MATRAAATKGIVRATSARSVHGPKSVRAGGASTPVTPSPPVSVAYSSHELAEAVAKVGDDVAALDHSPRGRKPRAPVPESPTKAPVVEHTTSFAEELQHLRRELQAVRAQFDASTDQVHSTSKQLRTQLSELAQVCRVAKKASLVALKQAAAFQTDVTAVRDSIGTQIEASAAELPALIERGVRAQLESVRGTLVREVTASGLEEVRRVLAVQAEKMRTMVQEAVAAEIDRSTAPGGKVDAAMRNFVETCVADALSLAPRSHATETTIAPCTPRRRTTESSGLEELEFRAAKAELQLRATKAELELQALKPETELRVLRAKNALREEGGGQRRRSSATSSSSSSSSNWDEDENWAPQVAPSSATEPELVLDRYEVWADDIIGQGGFSVVRNGKDKRSGETVAVKSYWDMEESGSSETDMAWLAEKCAHEVDVFKRLHAAQDMRSNILKSQAQKRGSWYIPDRVAADATNGLMNVFEAIPDPGDLFVRMLDYSAGPGDNGVCYIVLELAEYTLHEYLEKRQRAGLYLMADEVRDIALQLAQMLCGLHARNFVHADLKPLNVMHFSSGRWKLIDMDGMVSPGLTTACEVCYTPYYCAPEIAVQFAERRTEVDTSRLLDVWSLGMCFCELVTVHPVLEAMYQELYSTYQDSRAFLYWLHDPAIRIEVPHRVRELDTMLADLVGRMLQKDPRIRASMIEVMVHPYFVGNSRDGAYAVVEKPFNHIKTTAENYVRTMTLAVASRLGLLDAAATDATAASGAPMPPRRFSAMFDKRKLQQVQQTHRKRVSLVRFGTDPAANRGSAALPTVMDAEEESEVDVRGAAPWG